MTPHDEVTALFRDVVLVLGGVFALHPTSDQTIRLLAQGLRRAYQRARARKPRPPAAPSAHPALARLLRSARRSR